MTMSETVRFETPENVTVSYDLAGLGTRFLAWLYDTIIVIISELALIIVAAIIAFTLDATALSGIDPFSPAVIAGFVVIVLGFIPFMYFMLFEQFMNGQTPGKRTVRIRAVMAEGFSLTFASIFLRNVFRLVDTIPLLWAVPFLSARMQRFGDMVAGTIVVSEDEPGTHDVQAVLLNRDPATATFRFTPAQIKCLDEADFAAVEALLGRWPAMPQPESDVLTERMVIALAERMGYQPLPDSMHHGVFLADLLATHLQRQVGGLR
jgi:uncharacterized RDD family membrane protein YckC